MSNYSLVMLHRCGYSLLTGSGSLLRSGTPKFGTFPPSLTSGVSVCFEIVAPPTSSPPPPTSASLSLSSPTPRLVCKQAQSTLARSHPAGPGADRLAQIFMPVLIGSGSAHDWLAGWLAGCFTAFRSCFLLFPLRVGLDTSGQKHQVHQRSASHLDPRTTSQLFL